MAKKKMARKKVVKTAATSGVAPIRLLSTQEVADQIGCSRFTVGRVLREDPSLAYMVGERYVVLPETVEVIRARIPRAGR